MDISGCKDRRSAEIEENQCWSQQKGTRTPTAPQPAAQGKPSPYTAYWFAFDGMADQCVYF